MTSTARPTSILEPVTHGLAEQLARIARFRNLEHIQPEELDEVAFYLIGRVDDRAGVWERIQDDCNRLWFLITNDWDDRDLDEIPEADWARYSFSTAQQELDHRYEITRARLEHEIESAVRLARYRTAEAVRSARVARTAVSR